MCSLLTPDAFETVSSLKCLLNAHYRTFKIGCTARIKVVASADGNYLEVKLLDDVHNHPVSEVSATDR